MKTNLKVIPLAMGLAALLALPTTTKAQGTVTAIRNVPTAGGTVALANDLGHGLQLSNACHTGHTLVEFENLGTGNATLNYLYSDGTTVHASGVVLRPDPQPGFQVQFQNKRIEGQFIIANDAGNTTVNLHAFDGGTFCEIQGTVQFGPWGAAATAAREH
jgi:hypothetical protein